MEYGEDMPALTFTTEGATLVGMPELTCEATPTSPVGTYAIVVKQGTVANYNVTYVAGTLTITKASLNIAAGTYTKKQGEAMPEFSLTYTGFKNNETKDVLTKQPVMTCEATIESAPGEYPIIVSGAEARNYDISYTNGKLIVVDADAVIVKAKSYTREYGEANPTFEFTTEGATLVGMPEITCEATATSPVGTYDIIVKQGTVTNYNVTYVAGTLTITKAPLKASVGNYSREEGQENPEFAISYSGWKNNENESVLLKKPLATTEATKDSPVGEYAITISGGEAQNYEFEYVGGTLTVTVPSGIVALLASGQPFDVYTTTGVKVKSQVTTLKGLPRGVYIVNKMKVLVR
jgi:type IV secretory pathway protease TraF